MIKSQRGINSTTTVPTYSEKDNIVKRYSAQQWNKREQIISHHA